MPTDDVLAIVGRADELYSRRHNPGAVRESVMVLSGARAAAERYEIQWRLARALFFLGQEAGSRKSSRQLYSAGIEAGERSVGLNTNRVEGHFWIGVNLALFAESNRAIGGFRAIRRAKRELERAASISESYHDAGPLRVLGRLAHKVPRVLGGSLKRSRELFERALSISPSNTVTLIYAAELEIDCNDTERAITILKQLLKTPPDPHWEFENLRDRESAQLLLGRLEKI
jgi:tetratricopeptide (TPR) repeat protein